jgi:AcrR family transcriptional regulator
MSDKTDRRQTRTKQLLYRALISLLAEKGSESITVTDIAMRADINRGTFYLHYKDVPDMLEQIKDEIFGKLQSLILEFDPTEVAQFAFEDEPYPKLVRLFEEVERNADFYKVIFGPHGDISYAQRLRTFLYSHIFNKVSYSQPQEDAMLIPRDYLIAYISSANIGIIMHWIESGFNKTPYEMGLIMTQMVNHGPLIASGIREKPQNKR